MKLNYDITIFDKSSKESKVYVLKKNMERLICVFINIMYFP